jgi:hypothetical protein
MQTAAEIFQALGGPSRVAQELGIPSPATVIKWRQRQSIPSKYWPRLIALAERQGVPLNADTLLAANRAG